MSTVADRDRSAPDQAARDAEELLASPAFRRFLYAAIQAAGILGQHVPANGQLTRDLGFFEGRRSLGFDILRLAHAGQSEAIRKADSTGLATLHAALATALNPLTQPEHMRDRNRRRDTARYDELPGFDPSGIDPAGIGRFT